jgi:tetratricopeptide (TPR) repeat protein
LRRLRAPVLLFAGLLLAVVGLQVWLGTRPAAVSPPVSAPVSVQVPAPVPDAKIARQVVRTAVTLPLTPETTALVKAVQPELEAWLQQRDTPADERGEMWAALGTWAAHAGQAELAIRHWQAALTAYREVADLVSVARPTALVQQQLAAQARATQRWPAAEEHYRAARGLLELVRTHPQIGPSVRAELARVLTALGEAYQAQEQIDAAHRAYTEAEREYADLERTPAGALAETQLRLTHAKLLLKQQRTSEAAPVLERGRDLLPPLAHASQASTEQLELLLALWLLSAEVEQARNEPAARRTALETAQQVRQLLQMRQPQRADATQVQIDQGLAETLLEQGQFAAALTAAQSAVQQREQLVQAAPTDVGRLRDLVRAQAVLAQIHLRQNQPALAVPGLRALVQTRQRLVNLQPDQVVPAVDLAWANNSLGLALHNSQQTSEAIAAYQAAQAAVAEWEAHATEWKEPALVAGGAACNLAQCLLAANQVDAAQASVTVASARLQRLYTAEPMFRSVKLFLRNTHWTAARVDSRAGRHAQVLVAVTAAEQLSGATNLPLDLQVLRALALVHTDQVAAGLAAVEHVSTRSPYVLYNLACVWSVASTKGMSAERGARAVRLLRSAYAAGFREVTGLQADADLAPLRTRADYQQFLRELTATERAPAPRLQP